jgi:uncharacterized protein YqjF (DUF2071 family)
MSEPSKPSPDATKTAEFLTAKWVHLVMLNYEVDPGLLASRVPAGTTLDLWYGKCFVSMVGFQFLDTRVLSVPIPLHRDFEEVNLRFYVRREQDGERRRGVVFIKEIVPRAAIAWVARVLYNEAYVALPMAHDDRLEAPERHVSYSWEYGGRTCRLGLRAAGTPYFPQPDSEESFIAEHYWGYVRQRDGSTVEYQVEHPSWQVWRGEAPEFECDVEALYGAEFVETLSRPPTSAFLAKGSEIMVRRGRALQ